MCRLVLWCVSAKLCEEGAGLLSLLTTLSHTTSTVYTCGTLVSCSECDFYVLCFYV